MKAVGKHIVVKVLNSKEKKTEGGIYIPDKYDIPEQVNAEILSIGKDVKDDIKVGDIIIMNAFKGRNNMIKGEDDSIRVIVSDDIWGIIE